LQKQFDMIQMVSHIVVRQEANSKWFTCVYG